MGGIPGRYEVRKRALRAFLRGGSVLGLLLAGSACGSEESGSTAAAGAGCQPLSGTAWVPSVSGAGEGNRDGAVVIYSTEVTASGQSFIGWAQSGGLVSVNIPMDVDLGASGSLTLVAEVDGITAGLVGGGIPYLVSLNDGSAGGGKELVNRPTPDAAMYTCSTCSLNSPPTSPSAFFSSSHYESHQWPYPDRVGVNTFPTCNWSSGSPACSFNSTFFSGGKLFSSASGHVYVAQYKLVSDSYSSLSGKSANLKVKVIRKLDATAASGALDVNVILVGTDTISASRTSAGKANLDGLLGQVHTHLSQAGSGAKLGNVGAYEWTCEAGGDAYASLDIDDQDAMIRDGKTVVSGSSERRALNLFIVSSITDGGSNTGILGIAGMIGGPPTFGTGTAGVVAAHYGDLESMATGTYDYVDFGITLAHEIGHFLGMNHPTEQYKAFGVSTHDFVPDTPTCENPSTSAANSYDTNGDSVNDTFRFTLGSCLADTFVQPTGSSCSSTCAPYNSVTGVFCASNVHCEFNYLMWYTQKNFHETVGQGDGNKISANGGAIVNYHPLVQ